MSTVYIAGVYEQTGTSTIRYYGEAGAMRRAGFASSNGAFYLLSDQVKSTSVIASRAAVQADERIALICSGAQIAPRQAGNPFIP